MTTASDCDEGDGKIGIRTLDGRDLFTLYAYRKQILCLDNIQCLTRGLASGPLGVFSLLRPSRSAYAATGRAGRGRPVIGQMRQPRGSGCARLSLLLPCDALDSIVLPSLLEHLTVKAGMRGAMHFLAEVDERSFIFEALRRASFSVYCRQRLWLDAAPLRAGLPAPALNGAAAWRPFRKGDLIPVRSLYQSPAPALVQPMEASPSARSRGLVFQRGGEMLGYAEVVYGPRGIWVQPFVHPAAEEAPQVLSDLLCHIPHRGLRPVYVCIRSYQGWLEPALEDLHAEPGPRQVLMVKHLAISQRAAVPIGLPRLEKSRAEQTPVINLESK